MFQLFIKIKCIILRKQQSQTRVNRRLKYRSRPFKYNKYPGENKRKDPDHEIAQNHQQLVLDNHQKILDYLIDYLKI